MTEELDIQLGSYLVVTTYKLILLLDHQSIQSLLRPVIQVDGC
jgi:hypothetical protein